MQRSIYVSSLSFFMFVGTLVQAAPVPVGPPLPGSGDGLNSRWVEVDPANKPDTIAEAEAVLSLPGGVEAIVPQIAFYDSIGGHTDSGFPMPDPSGDPRFAVRYTGYLNIPLAASFVFHSFTDDGFKLDLGGETIDAFDGNRAPATSTSSPINLDAGLYPISFLGWEQGGLFVNELSWSINQGAAEIIPQANLFSSVPTTSVPDGGATLLMLGLGLILSRAMMVRRPR